MGPPQLSSCIACGTVWQRVACLQVMRMLLSSKATGAEQEQLQGHIPSWLLTQLRVAREPLSHTLLDVVTRSAAAVTSPDPSTALPPLPVGQLEELVHSGVGLVGRGCPAAALGAFYMLLLVDGCSGHRPAQVWVSCSVCGISVNAPLGLVRVPLPAVVETHVHACMHATSVALLCAHESVT